MEKDSEKVKLIASVDKEDYKKLQIKMIEQEMTVSEWVRRKISEELGQ